MPHTQVSDSSIRLLLRGVLNRHHVDTSCLQFGSFRGTVRLRGILRALYGGSKFSLEAIEALEQDLKRLRGVNHVHLHFTNYEKREEDGEWRLVAEGTTLKEAELSASTSIDEKPSMVDRG